MALFHFTVDQMKRSEGQSAIASAAYRSGERLYSEYYGEYSDYTRKGGVICSDILLPSHAPPEFADRQTLWNAVELVERGKKAQLAYSFEIALQNEFTIEENIALARQFLLDNFVSRGMTVDVAFHEKETEDGGLPKEFFSTGTNWKDLDKNMTIQKYNSISDKEHLKKILSMPVHFLLESGKGFFVKKDGVAIGLREELRPLIDNPVMVCQMKDVIDYRAMDYYQRRYRQSQEEGEL